MTSESQDAGAAMHLILVTGRSGSGKSSALNLLEDAGYCCMDNFPVRFLMDLFDDESRPADKNRFAVSVDVRANASDIARVPDIVRALSEKGVFCQILFLDADTPTLIRRFSETRRRHPLTDGTTELQSALSKESVILAPLLKLSDINIDTSLLTPSSLADALAKYFGTAPGDDLLLVLQSFGFKHGLPIEADFIFDVRCLPNPHWIPELRTITGKDPAVVEYLGADDEVARMVESISTFLGDWIDSFKQGSRAYMHVGIGCTGGRHRSVYVAEQVFARLKSQHAQTILRHRDMPT